MVERSFDVDGDGEDDESEEMPVYDLRLTHRKNDGVVWLRTVPLSAENREKDLRILAERYIDASSNSKMVFVRFADGTSLGTVSRRWGTQKIGGGDCQVAGRPAYRIDFELRDVNRAQAGDAAAGERVSLVLVDVDWKQMIVNNTTGMGTKFKVMLVAGYSNRPEDFDASLADYERLVGRFTPIEGGQPGSDCFALNFEDAEQSSAEAENSEAPADEAEAASTTDPAEVSVGEDSQR